jgi:hypothetical protein
MILENLFAVFILVIVSVAIVFLFYSLYHLVKMIIDEVLYRIGSK